MRKNTDWFVSIAEPLFSAFKTSRLITFAFTQTGSTEWVEENREMLSSRAVAYLNIDVSVAGPGFLPATTPQLDELLQQVTKVVCASYLKLVIETYPGVSCFKTLFLLLIKRQSSSHLSSKKHTQEKGKKGRET